MPLLETAFVLAAPGSGLDDSQTTTSLAETITYSLLLLLGFILINGFFVAAEFALVKLRDGQLDKPVEDGSKAAKRTRKILQNLDPYLSACQLGITISSIGLGAVSAPILAKFILPLLTFPQISDNTAGVISLIIAICIITFLHVIIGEQMPKVIALKRSLGTALFCARPLHWFFVIFRFPVWILNSCWTWLLKVIFKLNDEGSAHENDAMSSAELRVLVEETGEAREVTETEKEILMNALELNEKTVRDIIVPRNRVAALDINNSFEENLKIALETTHTRFPLIDGHLDQTKGLVHIKDLIRETQKDNPSLEAIRRDITIVIERLPLDDMLTRFQETKAHVALVVDEYGGSLGLAMLDDVLDQVVGDIHDEFDVDEDPRFEKISDDEFLVRGDYPLHELDDEIEELVLESEDVSTIGGYITESLGHLPSKGEEIEIEGFIARVMDSNERSVNQLRFTRIPVVDEDDGDPEDTTEEE